jgi:short-subunit dehydrogenase
MLSEALKEYGISVNSMCSGWVRTDMGGSTAPRTAEDADTAVWLATEADQKLRKVFSRPKGNSLVRSGVLRRSVKVMFESEEEHLTRCGHQKPPVRTLRNFSPLFIT